MQTVSYRLPSRVVRTNRSAQRCSMRIKSISNYIAPIFRQPDLCGKVDTVFAEVVNLVVEPATYCALVGDRIGNGPLNAVVDNPLVLSVLRPGDRVTGDGRHVSLSGGWRLNVADAPMWDAWPNYQALARRPQVVRANLDRLRTELPLEAPPSSLAASPAFHTQGVFGSRPAMAVIQSYASQLTDGLCRAYAEGNIQWIALYASRLAGMGPGLTPAGDDWLAGWLVGLRARQALEASDRSEPPLPLDNVAQVVLRSAEGNTHALSWAFLRAAAHGAVSHAWHTLLSALTDADPTAASEAGREVMRYGGTSGADMLAGFLVAFQGLISGTSQTADPC